jgi:hypothetical protein
MPNLDHAFAMITLELNVMQFVGKYGNEDCSQKSNLTTQNILML